MSVKNFFVVMERIYKERFKI